MECDVDDGRRRTNERTNAGLTMIKRPSSFSLDVNRLTADDVVTRVRRVFKGHADLLDGFRAFLPEVRAMWDGRDEMNDAHDGRSLARARS